MNSRVKSLLPVHACLLLLKSQVFALKSWVKFQVKLQVLPFEFSVLSTHNNNYIIENI